MRKATYNSRCARFASTGARACLHLLQFCRCMSFCNKCTIRRGGVLGHCRRGGKRFECSISRKFAYPPSAAGKAGADAGVDAMVDKIYPLVDSPPAALADEETRETEDVASVGVDFAKDEVGCALIPAYTGLDPG